MTKTDEVIIEPGVCLIGPCLTASHALIASLNTTDTALASPILLRAVAGVRLLSVAPEILLRVQGAVRMSPALSKRQVLGPIRHSA